VSLELTTPEWEGTYSDCGQEGTGGVERILSWWDTTGVSGAVDNLDVAI
jgi:hypothetical protein